MIESMMIATHPTNQTTQTTNQPFFWSYRGVVFLCCCFRTFPSMLVDFRRLWEASGLHFGSRMDPKWSQNRVKSDEPAKIDPRWLPRPSVYDAPVNFGRFWGPTGGPKNHQKSIFGAKGCPKERSFVNFCGQRCFS